MLHHSHNHLLIAASLAIALMAGFTGLSLTRGASGMTVPRRKLAVAMSALVLGGGIWSMHFVAMLGLKLSVQFYYDALTTMISALVAILITGIGLLLVHFGERTPYRISLAGACVGIGIPAMHYLGMSGMRVAEPVYSTTGILLAICASIILCVIAFWMSYGDRSARNILLGTAGFGLAVFAVHFVAMAGTEFVVVDGAVAGTLRLSNEVLAFGVTLTSFALAGAFLLVGVTFASEPRLRADPVNETKDSVEAAIAVPEDKGDQVATGRLPFEQNGRIHFIPEEEVAAIRAEGHYTFLYHSSGRLFCPWSISEVESRLESEKFLKCHRSYIINADFVRSFERKKDNGVCYFDADTQIEKAPVSRSYLKEVRATLGV